MKNRDIYLKDPSKQKLVNEGVANVNDDITKEAMAVLRYELETFVCDGQYEKGMELVLETYLKNINQAHQPAAWVSGFYGSGKSHLVKMLRALWVDKGRKLVNLGRYEEALQAYENALELNHDDSDALNRKGLALHYLNRYEEALQAYEKSLELNPDAFVVWFNKGIALNDLGRDEEALLTYDKALALNPDDTDAWYNKGRTLDNLDRREEALQAYDKALLLNPDNSDR